LFCDRNFICSAACADIPAVIADDSRCRLRDVSDFVSPCGSELESGTFASTRHSSRILFNMRQRRKFPAGNSFNDEPVAITLTTKSGHRHSSVRKRGLDSIRKSQWYVARDFFQRVAIA
jgi:hypothetical protein